MATKSSRQRVMQLRMSWAPPKLMDSVTVQFPTRVSQPVFVHWLDYIPHGKTSESVLQGFSAGSNKK